VLFGVMATRLNKHYYYYYYNKAGGNNLFNHQ